MVVLYSGILMTNGDISVSGGILQAAGGPVLLTFDGTSVTNDSHLLTVFDGALLTGGAEPGTRMTQTTAGQTNRSAWSALVSMSIVAPANIPVQGVNPAVFTAVTNPGNNSNYPSQATLRALAEDAAISDTNTVTKTEILAAVGLPE